MSFEGWILLVGALLLLLGAAGWLVRRLPFLTPAILYLAVGLALGTWGASVVPINPVLQPEWLHRAAEIAVIVSLFTVGLKVRLPLRDRRWIPPITLATVSMVLTVALVAWLGFTWLGLSLGAAVLLGAVLAPTDPVLASDVQVRHAADHDQLRLSLSIEAGLNDGTAFPFVMLGLGLLGLHPLGDAGWRWWTVDVFWAVGAGTIVGGLLGYAVGRWLLRLGAQGREGTGAAVYLVGGTIGVSYAVAVYLHAYGFLAVFAAAVALRMVERQASGEQAPSEPMDPEVTELRPGEPVDERVAAAHFTTALQRLSEYLERLLEIGLVILVGASLSAVGVSVEDGLFAFVLFVVVRPLAVLPLVMVAKFPRGELPAVAWLGIRGIGSVYYLFYALEEGVPESVAERLVAITLTVIAVSIVVHGLTVAPVLRALRPAKSSSAKRA